MGAVAVGVGILSCASRWGGAGMLTQVGKGRRGKYPDNDGDRKHTKNVPLPLEHLGHALNTR